MSKQNQDTPEDSKIEISSEIKSDQDLNGPNNYRNLSFTSSNYQNPKTLPSQPVQKKEIDIKILDHFTKDDNLIDYTLYTIKGFDSKGSIESCRRYKDFVRIRKILILQWPGCSIPDNMNPAFIKNRKAGLETFLKKVAELPHLHYSTERIIEEYQAFLRYLKEDLPKKLKTYKKVFYEEIAYRYTQTFPSLSNISGAKEAREAAGRFLNFLERALLKIQKLRATVKEVVKAQKKFYQGIAALQTLVAIEYEREIFSEYKNRVIEKPVFTDNQIEEKISKIKNNKQSIELFDEWLGQEQVEIEVLMGALKGRVLLEDLIKKVMGKQESLGKKLDSIATREFSLRVFFKINTKEGIIAGLNHEILSYIKELKALNAVADMVALINFEEVKKFQVCYLIKRRSFMFHEMINMMASRERENVHYVLEYWSIIQQNSS